MEQVYGPELSPAAGAVANIPQKSIRKNACRRVYAPATKLRSRKAALKLAHATGSLKFYGTLTAPSLLARKTLTFADFLREPEIREWILAQEDSDATAMMDEILAEGSCCHTLDDTCAYLKLLCRRRAAERLQPIRYWQRVKNSLLYPYLGVHAALDWNRKAEKGEVARLDRHGPTARASATGLPRAVV